MKSQFLTFCSLAALGAAVAGCQLFITTEVGKGIGQSCASDNECQAGVCSEGSCAVECSGAADCPAPALCGADGLCRLKSIGLSCAESNECQGGTCFNGFCTSHCDAAVDCAAPALCTTNQVCELPLKVGFVYVGVPQDEGWTLTHEQGRVFAAANLPYLDSSFVQNTFLPDDAKKAIDTFVEEGKDVIVANSFSLRQPVAEKALQYPDKKFLTCSANLTGNNLGSYFGRMEQAYYLAGYAAGLKTKTERLGFVGSYITPEVVRHINAFTLGARLAKEDIVVEVRWVGFWFDTNPPIDNKYAETRLTEQLIETGCDVIGHNMDNGRSIEAVEEAAQTQEVYSVGNDNEDACSKGPTSCLGTTYWNWGPLYVHLFDEIHRNVWDPKVIINENIGVDPATSTANFTVNGPVAGTDIEIAVANLLSELAKPGNEHLSFKGPYCSTGQRTPNCVGPEESVEDEELRSMCWFVQGVVEKVDPENPMSLDKAAQVPPECQQQQ